MAKSSVSSTVHRGNKPDEQTDQPESETPECAWAVCVRPQNIDDARGPKLFVTKREAEAFLLEIPPEDTPAEQPDILNDDKHLDEYRRQFPTRDMVQVPVKAPHLIRWRKLNLDHGWHDPVPVEKVIPATAEKDQLKKDPPSLRTFFSPDKLGVALPLSSEDTIDRATESLDSIEAIGLGEYTYCLDRYWRFDEIEADARKRIGHQFEGLRHASVLEIVVKAVYDLEDSLLYFHPAISDASRATFFQSWQLQRHIAVFCDRLSRSSTARTISKGNGHEQASGALEFMCQKLAVYAHTIFPEEVAAASKPEATASATRGKPGPRQNAKRALRIYEIVTKIAGEGDWRLKLEDILVALDEANDEANKAEDEEAKIPPPEAWLKHGYRDWTSACVVRSIAIKMIKYWLDQAKQQKKPAPETFS